MMPSAKPLTPLLLVQIGSDETVSHQGRGHRTPVALWLRRGLPDRLHILTGFGRKIGIMRKIRRAFVGFAEARDFRGRVASSTAKYPLCALTTRDPCSEN